MIIDPELFPGSFLILNYEGEADGSGGLILRTRQLPLALGVYIARPNKNGWVVGQPRGYLPGLGDEFDDDVANMIFYPPYPPTNIVDIFSAVGIGPFHIGLGAGYSWDLTSEYEFASQAEDFDDRVEEYSAARVLTGRLSLGAHFRLLIPVSIQLGAAVSLGQYLATYTSGQDAVPVASAKASISAENLAVNICFRGAFQVAPTLKIAALSDVVLLPQNYEATDDNGAILDTQPTQLQSLGYGLGTVWTPNDAVLVSSLVTVIVEGASFYIEETSDVEPAMSGGNALIIRGVLSGEFKICPWLIVRGGIGIRAEDDRLRLSVDSGEIRDRQSFISPDASAGLGFALSEQIQVNFALNLFNLAEADYFRTLAVRTTLEAEL